MLPAGHLRGDLPLPDNSELDVVRHFTRLSQRTFSIDVGFYPLGSCTMKYNPRINDAMASLPGFAIFTRSRPTSSRRARSRSMYELERSLADIFGMAAFSLNPSAGAHAELTALLIAKAYFAKKRRGQHAHDGDRARHGARHEPGVGRDGRLQGRLAQERRARARRRRRDCKAVLGDDTAVCMMTNPNTLGLFEDHIDEIAAAVHAAGGLMYYDGANANALMGNARPGDMGFDLMHLNLHKTFSIPHGGGGAGHGPVGVAAHLVDFLPVPVVRARATAASPFPARFRPARFDRPDALVLVEFRARGARADVRLANGGDGLDAGVATGRAQRELRARPGQRVLTTPRTTRRAATSSSRRAQRLKRETGVKALDHRESAAGPRLSRADDVLSATRSRVPDDRADRDRVQGNARRFVAALREIVATAKADPHAILAAPVNTVVGRIDETRAARQPDLRF